MGAPEQFEELPKIDPAVRDEGQQMTLCATFCYADLVCLLSLGVYRGEPRGALPR